MCCPNKRKSLFWGTNKRWFAEWEKQEQKMQELLGDVSILKETVNGEVRRLPLVTLRSRVEQQSTLFDPLDIGGCGCFVEFEEEE